MLHFWQRVVFPDDTEVQATPAAIGLVPSRSCGPLALHAASGFKGLRVGLRSRAQLPRLLQRRALLCHAAGHARARQRDRLPGRHHVRALGEVGRLPPQGLGARGGHRQPVRLPMCTHLRPPRMHLVLCLRTRASQTAWQRRVRTLQEERSKEWPVRLRRSLPTCAAPCVQTASMP